MKPQKFKELLDRYSKGACTPEEEKLINDWYQAIGNSSDEEFNEPAHEEINSRKLMETELWSKINPRPVKVETGSPRYFMRAAAAIILVALVGSGAYFVLSDTRLKEQIISFQNSEPSSEDLFTQLVNRENEPEEIVLSDGSQVILKPNSEIRFPQNFTADKREVHLTGEAFFNVKRDESRPFLVYSNEVVTKVLGTSFNIKAYLNEKEITVAVKTGKVSVSTKTENVQSGLNATVILTPNQQIVYNRENEQVSKQLVEKPEIILPQPTLFRMSYDGAPVTKIFEVLEENYGVDIEYDEEALAACVLTTSMSDEGLYERIQIICKAINAEYTITDAVISIKSPGCF